MQRKQPQPSSPCSIAAAKTCPLQLQPAQTGGILPMPYAKPFK